MRRVENIKEPFAEARAFALLPVIAKPDKRNDNKQIKMNRGESVSDFKAQRILKRLEVKYTRKSNERVKNPF